MSSTVMIDGLIVAPEAAVVSVFDRGFLYGDSIFETLRTYGGVPFALDEHLARLQRSAERVFIALPTSRAVLRDELLRAVHTQGSSECYVRVSVTRGVGRTLGLDPELAREPLRVVIVTALSPPPDRCYTEGVAAITHRADRMGELAGAPDAKIGNYLVAVLAVRAAHARGAHEALIEDAQGRILEGATSNVFAVFGDTLVTAPESAEILPGITRAYALRIAQGLGVFIELRPLTKAELSRADEVFISSSIRELMPVVQLDERVIGPGVPGPMTQLLLRAFREAANQA